jgi:hypothetical protein
MAAGDLTSLDNVKTMIGIDVSDTSADAVLALLITSQSAAFVEQIGRNVLSASYTETLDGHSDRIRARTSFSPWSGGFVGGLGARSSGYALTLLNTPVASIQSVTVDGTAIPQGSNPGQDTQVDGWSLLGDRIELIGGTYAFTAGTGNVVIVYTAGYTTTPAHIERAVIEWVEWEYRKRDRAGQRSKVVGGESVMFMVDAIPPGVQALIDILRKPVKV